MMNQNVDYLNFFLKAEKKKKFACTVEVGSSFRLAGIFRLAD